MVHYHAGHAPTPPAAGLHQGAGRSGVLGVGERHSRANTSVNVDHPTVADTDTAKTSSDRLVDRDQARGEVSCVPSEMP